MPVSMVALVVTMLTLCRSAACFAPQLVAAGKLHRTNGSRLCLLRSFTLLSLVVFLLDWLFLLCFYEHRVAGRLAAPVRQVVGGSAAGLSSHPAQPNTLLSACLPDFQSPHETLVAALQAGPGWWLQRDQSLGKTL